MILPYDANPGRMEFSERTGTKAALVPVMNGDDLRKGLGGNGKSPD
jgi:hypothetical protein